MRSNHPPRLLSAAAPGKRRQRGVVLFIALIALVALSLTGIALMRSVDTTTLAAGNLAFRKSATLSTDTGIETAITFLNGLTTGALNVDNPGNNYFSTYSSRPTGGNPVPSVPGTVPVDSEGRPSAWGAGTAIFAADTLVPTGPTTTDAAGNTISYVVQRMCNDNLNSTTADRTDKCITDPPPTCHSSSGCGALPYPEIYYRITVRVQGPRNTASYVQAMVSK